MCIRDRHEGFSKNILETFKDESFDWVYIDADHRYKAVKEDIEAAKFKVKPGGYLVFNDFARIDRVGLGTFGVHQAVCEFIAKEKWDITHFAFHPKALYDIALQKPKA